MAKIDYKNEKEPFEDEESPYTLADKLAAQAFKEGWTLQEVIKEVSAWWEISARNKK
jgi:hypothetical protein